MRSIARPRTAVACLLFEMDGTASSKASIDLHRQQLMMVEKINESTMAATLTCGSIGILGERLQQGR